MRYARPPALLAFVGLAVFAVLMLAHPLPDATGRTVSYAVRTLTGVAAGAAMWRRGLRGSAQMRRPRLLVAAALLCGCVSGLVAAGYQLATGQPPPVPSAADLTYFLLLPLAVAGLLTYPVDGLSEGSKLRSLIEGLIAGSALWFATYTVLLGPAGVGAGLPLASSLTVLGYPVSDVLLIAIATSVLSRIDDEARFEVLLCAGGLSLLAFSDLAYSVLQAGGGYRADSWVALVGEAGLLLIVAAARLPGAVRARPRGALAPLAPFLPVGLVCGVGVAGVAGALDLPGTATAGLLVLVAALVLRHLVSVRDNAALVAKIAEREDLFRSLVTASSDLITLHEQDGTLLYISPSAARQLGIAELELVGRRLTDFAHPEDLAAAEQALSSVHEHPGGSASATLRVRTADGQWRWMETVMHNLLDNPHVGGVVCNTRDIHERVLLEQRLSDAAFQDSLTGLPNRRALTARVEGALAEGGSGALLWLDLDGFKEINDALGHKVGDDVLKEVGRRLSELVREPDLVGRLGGDEFVIFSEELTEAQALALAARTSDALREPMRLADATHTISTSIGIALTPAADASTLLAAADVAMYEAKASGAGKVALFDVRLFSQLQERLALTADLRGAVDRGELQLVYQPLVHLATNRVTSVEALLRWQHPKRGLLPPDAFLPLAERSGLIVEIGSWVIVEACRQLSVWQASLPGCGQLRMAVNLAAQQIADPALVAVVSGALLQAGTSPSTLTLEVTETSMMEDVGAAVTTLAELRRLGVRIAIDDFGTGYSSLNYLKQFPVQEVKLDKSFVDGVGTNADDSAIVAAVVTLARAIGLDVVAEGVESVRQQRVLQTLGCDYGQGYLWHRPAAPGLIEPWLTAHVASADQGLRLAGKPQRLGECDA